ncbi:pilus assembly FimT family protein [Thalassoroseus pseudoceratinae]|uniref:pilus assembly FimT family protein n=1 Tax=Thalassoroseus pseudoceratinae TaxID=2713176 RepID=UPI001424251C|nr:hypothetical protein [Thalassoroseus pseudoceratinae]
MLIIGVLSVAAVPQYTGMMHRYRIDAAAKRLKTDLKTVQTDAVTSSQTRSIVFEPAEVSYDIAESGQLRQERRVDLSAPPFHLTRMEVFSNDPDLEGELNEVEFSAYGYADHKFSIRLELGRESRLVTVESRGTEANIISVSE